MLATTTMLSFCNHICYRVDIKVIIRVITMSGNPFLSGRIPQDLHDRLTEHCNSCGMTRTELMIAALRSYLDCPEPIKSGEVKVERVERLETEIESLWEEIEKLKSPKKEIEGIEVKQLSISDNMLNNTNDNKLIPEESQEMENSDNITDNCDKFPKYLLNESAMAEIMPHATRNSLRYRRKDQTPSHEMKTNFKTLVHDEWCTIWYWGTEPRGKKITHMWAAHPIKK